ncbi:hypothetical protein BJX66DRAFT_54008 [Aspergillus keveii]|jgi:hypothetical protein|uniref:Uncharacterized protein n=1 Tax=Aspergillus keveii TaxID=714993 RepID=A0ABR4GGN0_9EURO
MMVVAEIVHVLSCPTFLLLTATAELGFYDTIVYNAPTEDFDAPPDMKILSHLLVSLSRIWHVKRKPYLRHVH